MSTRSYVEGDADGDFENVAGVTPIVNEPFRYHVASRTPGTPDYLVDLESWRWNGECGCRRFEIRCAPKLSRGEKPAARLRCWHIERARAYYFLNTAPKLAAAIRQQRTQIQYERTRPPLSPTGAGPIHNDEPTESRPVEIQPVERGVSPASSRQDNTAKSLFRQMGEPSIFRKVWDDGSVRVVGVDRT